MARKSRHPEKIKARSLRFMEVGTPTYSSPQVKSGLRIIQPGEEMPKTISFGTQQPLHKL
jgi:hypothetical protein